MVDKKKAIEGILYMHSNVEIENISTSLPKPHFWNTGKLLIFSFGLFHILPIKKELLSLTSNHCVKPVWRWERKFLFKKRADLIFPLVPLEWSY